MSFYTIGSIIISIVFAYNLIKDEVPDEPKPTKTNAKRSIKVKKNGQWIDEEE